MSVHLRAATPEDAPDLARLVDMAGEGLPRTLWAQQADYGQDPLDVGAIRAARATGVLTWRNATIAANGDRTAGFIITQMMNNTPEIIDSDTHFSMRPLVRLQNMVPGTCFIVAAAVHQEDRRAGVGSALLHKVAATPGPLGVCTTIVGNANAGALAFFAAHDFHRIEELPVVQGDWETANTHWVLLRKAVA